MAFVGAPLPSLAPNSTSTSSNTNPIRPVTSGFFLPTRPARLAASTNTNAARQVTPVMTFKPYTAIVTGASSSIGLHAAKELVARGDYHVVMAVRNIEKAKAAAENLQMPSDSYTILPVDLASLASVRAFVQKFQSQFSTLNSLVCNAATWHPRDKKPRFTEDGFDETVQVNHLSHFLLANLLLPMLKRTKGRCVFLATQTHNPDTLPGKIPPQADLGQLQGMTSGFNSLPGTIDGKAFEPTKAYKDSKVCNILTMKEMHRRYSSSGVTFTAVFPGCIAESDLFREKRGWFRWFFPLFQKYVTRQLVPVEEAGRRVALVASDGRFGDSGEYWQWRGSYLKGMDKTAPVPIEATDREAEKAEKLWELSSKLVNMGA